jgi:TolB-like protein
VSLILALLCALAGKPTVAVLYFDYSGTTEDMGLLRKGLAQMLISDLARVDAVQLVERDRLEAVLAELKLAKSGAVDPTTAAKVGKLLGARYLVLGGYFDLAGTLRVDARVVEVETGRLVQSVAASGKPDDFLAIEQKLAADLGAVLAAELKLPAAATTRPARVKAPAKLSARVAVLYSRGLHEMDRGEKEKAKATLQAVVKAEPDFSLAGVDLDKLMQ